MKKHFSLILALVLMLTLAACGNGNSPADNSGGGAQPAAQPASSGDSSAPAADSGDIGGDLVLWFGIEDLGKAFIEAFNVHYPNVNVKLEIIGMEAGEKLSLDGPSGIGGDVIMVNHNDVFSLFDDGLIEPYPADVESRLRNILLDFVIDMPQINGNLYGVPFSLENYGLLYNKDLVDKPPETIEELFEFAESYNDPSTGKYAMRWLVNDFYHNYWLFSAFGFKPFGPDGTDWKNPGFDSPEFAQGLELHRSLRAIFEMPTDDADFEATMGAFGRGEVPFTVAHSWLAAVARDNGVNVAGAKLPTINGVQPRCLLGMNLLVVSSYANNFDAAFAFAEFAASPEAAGIMYGVNGVGNGLKDTSGIEGYAEDEVLLGFAEQTPYTESFPQMTEFNLIWGPVQEMMAFNWDDKLTVEDAQKKFMEDFEMALNVSGQSMYD